MRFFFIDQVTLAVRDVGDGLFLVARTACRAGEEWDLGMAKSRATVHMQKGRTQTVTREGLVELIERLKAGRRNGSTFGVASGIFAG